MRFPFFLRGRRGTMALVAGIVVSTLTVSRLLASDHQDNPFVELNPAMDMTDVYAFPSPTAGRMALAMNSWAFLTPAQTPTVSFDPNLLYQFKVDNTGDAREDRVIQLQFFGTAPNQTVEVRGPAVPTVVGAMGNKILTGAPTVSGPVGQVLGSATGVQVFTGPREDPFFIDLEQFFRIIPDRKPSTGTLSMLPEVATASGFRTSSNAVDFVKGFNVLSIVVELPTTMLTAGGNAKLGIWGTISR